MFYIVKIPPSTATHLCFYSDVVKMLAWRQKPGVLAWVLTYLGTTVTKVFSSGRQALRMYCYPETGKTELLNTQQSCPSISLIMCLYFGFFKNKSIKKYDTFPASQLWKHLSCLINKEQTKCGTSASASCPHCFGKYI